MGALRRRKPFFSVRRLNQFFPYFLKMRSAVVFLVCMCFAVALASPLTTTTAEALDAKPIQEAFEEEEAKAIKVAKSQHERVINELQDGSWDEGLEKPAAEVEMEEAEATMEQHMANVEAAPSKEEKKKEVKKAMKAATKVEQMKGKAQKMEKSLHSAASRSTIHWGGQAVSMLVAVLLVAMH